MFIVAGKLKGRKFTSPRGLKITEGRIKEVLHNVLPPLGGLRVLDLFAGSGALGFEAMSWGSAEAVFVELDRRRARLVKDNIILLGLSGHCCVFCADAFSFLGKEQMNSGYDLVFLDPPYGKGLVTKSLKSLNAYDILTAGNIVVCLSSWQEDIVLEDGFLSIYRRRYGDRVVNILEKQ